MSRTEPTTVECKGKQRAVEGEGIKERRTSKRKTEGYIFYFLWVNQLHTDTQTLDKEKSFIFLP